MPQCLEVNPFNYAIIQFRRLFHTVMWLFDYWKNIIDFVLRFQFFALSVHQLLFSCPITVKNAEHTCTRDITDEEAVSVFVSLFSSVYYYCCCIIPSSIAGKTYVFRCNPLLYLKWSLGTNPPVFLLDYYTISSVPYSLSLRLINHVAKSYYNHQTKTLLYCACCMSACFHFSSNFLTLFLKLLDLFFPFCVTNHY